MKDSSQPEFLYFSESLKEEPKKTEVSLIEEKLAFKYKNTVDYTCQIPKNTKVVDDETEYFNSIVFTDESDLALIKINDKVGYGVFARRDFEINQCHLIYSGEFVKSSPKERSDYGYEFSNKEYSINAKRVGNLTRFISHMPEHKSVIENRNKNFDKKSTKLDKKLFYWYENNLVLKGIKENQIAFANLLVQTVKLRGKYCVIMLNNRKIRKGEQLGFPYGIGYWISGKKKLPELFFTNGSVVPKKNYSFKNCVAFANPQPCPIILENSFPIYYDEIMYKQDLKRKRDILQGVWFSILLYPYSFFKLRDLLVKCCIVDKETHGAIKNCPIVEAISKVLPKHFRLKKYKRDPYDPSNNVYDIVIETEEVNLWSQLTNLIKSDSFLIGNIENKCLKLFNTVIAH